jgi:hypothetical protein
MRLDTPIIDGIGGAHYAVGGPDAYRSFERRGLKCSLEWVDGEPAMLIWKAREGFDAGVFGICLSSAGKYADPSGDPTPACFREAWRALPVLGLPQLEIEASNLVSCIIDWVPHLLTMPPQPPALRQAERGPALWEVTQEDADGRRLSEVKV